MSVNENLGIYMLEARLLLLFAFDVGDEMVDELVAGGKLVIA